MTALGRRYWIEVDLVRWGKHWLAFNRAYAKPPGLDTSEMVAEFTVGSTCRPDCAHSVTYLLKVTMQGPKPGLPLPKGLVLHEYR